MKLKGKSTFLLHGLLAAFVCCSMNVVAGVFDDAVFVLQGDADADGDGVVRVGEAKDARERYASDPISLLVRGTVDGSTTNEGVVCPVTDVVMPRRGVSMRSRVLRLKTATQVYSDGTNAAWASGFTMAEGFPATTCVTAVIRFRWEGVTTRPDGTELTTRSCLFSCLGSGTDGFCLSIVKSKDSDDGYFLVDNNPTWCYLNNEEAFKVEKGKWYDVAIAADRKAATLYFFPEGKMNYKWIRKRPCGGTFFNDVRTNSCVGIGVYMTRAGNNNYYPQDSWTYRELDHYEKNFNGDLHQVAIWNRVLSEAEIEEAFMGGESADFQVGIANGSSDEFAVTSSGAYRPSDGWLRMKGRFEASGEYADIVFTNRSVRPHARVLHMKTCPGSDGLLTLLVNGNRLETQTVKGAADVCFHIPSNVMMPGEECTLRLLLEEGAGLGIDWLEMGGGFDRTLAAHEQDPVGHLHDEDPNNLWGYISSRLTSKHTNIVWRFSLSAKLAQTYGYRWTFVRDSYIAQNVGAYDVIVNGKTVYENEGIMPLSWSFDVPPSFMKEGLNTIILRNLALRDDDTGYYAVKSLTVSPLRRRGLAISVR